MLNACSCVCISFFVKYFPIKKKNEVVHLFLTCSSSPCILNMDTFPGTFLYVFFQSVACQFIFLVISLMKELTLF